MKNLNQFISYFFVGLSAALVEWITFWLCNSRFGFNIYVATIIAFVCATVVNWSVARRTTFKESARFIKPTRDIMPVFVISGVGLILNLILMGLISDILGVYPLIAKIVATGIVFFWNFGARKILIYK